MYIPASFQVTDRQALTAFIKQNSFGTLFSQTEEEPFATHLPFLLESDEAGELYLLGHMAKTNPHWRLIEGRVLVVFQGPHAYISPAWYEEEQVAPTWNYAAVHVYGEFGRIEDRDALVRMMADTIHTYESPRDKPWTTDMDSNWNTQLLKAVVGFKIKIVRMEGKWKMSQNHSAERRRKVIRGLRLSPTPSPFKRPKLWSE